MSVIRIAVFLIVAAGVVCGVLAFDNSVPSLTWVVLIGLFIWAIFGGVRVDDDKPGYHDKMQAICNQLAEIHNSARMGGYTVEMKQMVAELEARRVELENSNVNS